MRFVKTVSFLSSGRFNSAKDDEELNRELRKLQESGATILQITVRLAGQERGVTALYVIEYEAGQPLP
jgi:hypothetical protein